MRRKIQTTNYNFRVEPRVKSALEEMADAYSLCSSAFLRTLILKEYSNFIKNR